jgi:ribonuclease HI
VTSVSSCAECGQPVLDGELFVEMVVGQVQHLMCPLVAETAPEIVVPKLTPPVTPLQGPTPGPVEVFTDGACRGNPGRGGWAWVTGDGRQAQGASPHTTNQRMEIRAALEAVLALPGPLVVVSDSTYVVNCFQRGWWRRWQRQGWTTSARTPVVNRDLWEPLIDLVTQRGDVTFKWIKGHSGNKLNDRADKLAVQASHTL